MVSPARPSPIPAAPQREIPRKRSKVLQSSLDLVFSYSRSQQLLYGKHLKSAPSFLETSSHSLSPSDNDYLRRDIESGHPSDDEGDHGQSSPDGVDYADSDPSERRRSSISPVLFAPDPILSSSPAASASHPDDGSSSGNTTSGEPTPKAGLLNLLPSTSTSLGRGKVGNASTERMYSGSSSSTVRPSGAGGSRTHPAQKVYERNKVELSDEVSPTRVPDEDSPLLGRDTAQSKVGADVGRVKYGALEERRNSVMGEMRRASEVAAGLRRKSSTRRRSIVGPLGQSTDGQTLFNAVAVLLGIGVLSLPLALAYAGWIAGTGMLIGFAWLTCHTAKLLARLIRADGQLMGYTDIGRAAFGRVGGIGINALFCLELFALGVALIVLFGDTLEAIFPQWSSNTYKVLGLIIIVPTTLLPLHLLSLPSLLSTISTILLVIIILLDGFIKTKSPGSLLHPANTSWTPEWKDGNWLGGIGLVLAGFGGHAVVPSLARDMQRPEHFDKVINMAFGIAAGVSFVAGAAGYLMIGNVVSDEITRDLMQPKYGYPRVLNLIALWMIVIIPVTKFGLCSRPLNNTVEALLGFTAPKPTIENLSEVAVDDTPSAHPSPNNSRIVSKVHTPPQDGIPRYKIYRVFTRTLITCLCCLTGVVLPGFGKVMAFLGSFSAFLICIILPLGFYLRLGPKLVPLQTSIKQKAAHWILVFCSLGLMVAGTVWAFLPGSGHGDLEV